MDHLKKIADDVDGDVVRNGLAGLRAVAAGPLGLTKAARTQYVYKNPQNEFTIVQVNDLVSYMHIPEREFYRIDSYMLTYNSGLTVSPNMAEMTWICEQLNTDYPDAKVYPVIPAAEAGIPAGYFMVNVVFTVRTKTPNII